MKIIDFAQKGNVVRFYLGDDDCVDYTGDDWNDRPYEHNASLVYNEYIKDYIDYTFNFDNLVLQPRDGYLNSPYSKKDMKERKVPCIISIPKEYIDCNHYDFAHYIGNENIDKFYFGDSAESLHF